MDLCQKLVGFDSVENNTSAVFDFMQAYLQKAGFAVELIYGTSEDGQKTLPALYASIGQGQKHLLFSGHLDVVSAGDESKWRFPPFAAEIADGVLYGRGIADMKGGVAAFVSAAIDMVKTHKFNGKISLLLASDEETATVETTKKALQVLAQRGEKFDFSLVGEPSNPNKLGEEIKIGRRGDVVLNITSFGTQGHTAYPHLADNPIHHLVELLIKLKNHKFDDGNEFFGPSSLQMTTIDVGNKASNVVPEKAFAQLDVRFNSEQNSQKIISLVQKYMAETEGKFELKADVVGESFLSPKDENVQKLCDIITAVCGITPEYSTSGGTSDARFVAKYCPVVEFGLTNATIHKVNECEKTENIEKLKLIYEKFLQSFFLL